MAVTQQRSQQNSKPQAGKAYFIAALIGDQQYKMRNDW